MQPRQVVRVCLELEGAPAPQAPAWGVGSVEHLRGVMFGTSLGRCDERLDVWVSGHLSASVHQQVKHLSRRATPLASGETYAPWRCAVIPGPPRPLAIAPRDFCPGTRVLGPAQILWFSPVEATWRCP